ncbi:telomere binding protein [Ceratobasidium sp. 395]|nr:telomere binding protein [Ceratobasidium sp. 395]
MTTTTQEIITRLRQPVSSLTELEELLTAPLISLRVNVPKPKGSIYLTSPPTARQIATLQSVILTYVYPTWESQTNLPDLYFVPTTSSADIQSHEGIRTLVLGSLPILTTPPLSNFAIHLLEKLVAAYDLDEIWQITRTGEREGQTGWDRALAAWMGIPGKVANALLAPDIGQKQDIPSSLEFGEFTTRTCLASERIMWIMAQQQLPHSTTESELQRLTHLVSKLISTGHFSDSSPSFIPLALPQICVHITSAYGQAYIRIWSQITKSLPGPQLQTFTISLLNYLDTSRSSQSQPLGHDTPISLHPSITLQALLGPAPQASSEVWHVMVGSGRTWSRTLVRSIIGWAAGLNGTLERLDEKGIALVLEQVLARWSDPQHVARALLKQHRYLTSLLVLALGSLSSFSPNSASPAPDQSSDSFPDGPPLDLNDIPAPSSPVFPTASTTTAAHPLITSTSTSPVFLHAIGAYLSQRDEAVRRCGMFVAEVVASGKLDFGDWEGEKEWQVWTAELRGEAKDPLRSIREEVEQWSTQEMQKPGESTVLDNKEPTSSAPEVEPDISHVEGGSTPPEPDSDDDSLVGYDSPSPTSSRAPSPTPSELADPTLRRRYISRPVYLAELGALLVEAPKNVVEVQPSEQFGTGGKKGRRGMGITGGRGGGDAEDEKGRVEMALEVGAQLIRRKRGYGSELDENAVNLAYMFVGLQDNFDLDQFEEKRQDVLVALVVCSPTKAAPTIIEQFFHHQYSTAQRFTMLNALALGARELAGLPIPPSRNINDKRPKIDFPSKVLPGQAHLEYITESDLPPVSSTHAGTNHRRIESARAQVSAIVENLSGQAITRSKQDTEAQVPQIVRERALKVGPRSGRGITPVDSVAPASAPPTPMALGYLSSQTPVVPFAQVAAEYFVAPLINRFWAHLRGSLEREAYGNATRTATGVRTGTGTGLILSPLVLAHLLGTLSVLLHASRHAPAYLHVLAPDAAELALAVGTQPMSHNKHPSLDGAPEENGTEAGVLVGALELTLTVLDAAIELDGGRVFALERTELLVGIGQWGSTVFEALDSGKKAPGQGGAGEEKVVRIAAGVVLTVQRMIGRWKGSMVMV